MESIHLQLSSKHQHRLGKGHNIQLDKEELHHALTHEPNTELHMAKKHITAIHRAHHQGKGKRIDHKHIHGGKINLGRIFNKVKDVGRKVIGGVKTAMKNPIVRKTVQQLGHIATSAVTQKMADQGVNITPYTNLAHDAIDSGHINKDAVAQAVSNDVLNKVNQLAGTGMRKVKRSKNGGRLNIGGVFKSIGHALGAVASNPVVQHVATDMASHALAGAMMGAGARKVKRGRHLIKGSEEAREHMAKIRSMRHHKHGGALFVA